MYIRLEGLFYIAGDLLTLLGLWQKVCKERRARPCQAHSSSVLPEHLIYPSDCDWQGSGHF